jgi:hypothetical protein
METEVVEDVKRAKPCDCGHALALHDADGAGPCTLCDCLGPPLSDEPDPVADAVAAEVLPVE